MAIKTCVIIERRFKINLDRMRFFAKFQKKRGHDEI
jgi:hypothetical protein